MAVLRGRLDQLGSRARASEGWVLAGVVFLGCLFLWELVSMSGVPVARDMQMFFVPQRHLLWEALQSGRLPLWTPHMGTGAPLLANLQSGVFYPPHWLYAVLPFFTALNLLIVFHFVLGGAGTYVLARKLELSRSAGFAAAVAFMLGGYFASLLNLINAQQAAAWMPLMVWTSLQHLERRAVDSFGLLVGVLLLGLLAGEPQTFLLGAMIAGLFTLTRWPGRDPIKRQLSLATSFGLAALLTAGLAMVQLLPTAELVSESGRGGEGLGFEQAAYYSLMPVRLLNLFIPADYHDPVYRYGVKSLVGTEDPWLFSVYVGALAALFLIFAWRVRSRRRQTVLLTGLFAVGLVLAVGQYTPVYRWLYDILPGFRAFRFPEKYFLFCGLSAALLTGVGIDGMRNRRWSRADLPLALLSLIVLLALRTFVGINKSAVIETMSPHLVNALASGTLEYAYTVWVNNLNKWIMFWAIGLTLAALYRRRVLSEPWFAVAIVAVVAADFAVAHRALNPTVDASFYESEPLITRHLPMEEIQRDYRYRATSFDQDAGAIKVVAGVPLEAQKWLWQQTMQPNTSQLRRVMQVDIWDALMLRKFVDEIDFYRMLPDPERRWRLLRLTSVKYFYSTKAVTEQGYRRQIPLDSLPGYLYEVEDPLPRAYVVSGVRHFPNDEETINGILGDTFDPRREVAFVDTAAVPRAPAETNRHSDAEIVYSAGEEVWVRVSPEQAGYLILTDTYYPGWEAKVDGEPREIRLANFFFRAVPIRPGDREVVFRYRPRPLELGAVLSIATLVLGAAGMGLVGLRRGIRAQTRKEANHH